MGNTRGRTHVCETTAKHLRIRRAASIVVAAVLAAGCGSPAPSAAPATGASSTVQPQATVVAMPSATPAPAATPVPMPAFADESAAFYLVDVEHPIVLDFDAGAIMWTPRTGVVVPGGKEAVRVGLMPVRCPGEEDEAGSSSAKFDLGATRAWDAWEAALRAGPMIAGMWSVEPSGLSCVDGGLVGSIRGITFYPIAGTEDGVPLSASGSVGPGQTMTVVAVYSALDLENPSFTMDASTIVTLGRAGTKPILATTVGPHDLPDGSTTDHAGFQVTGCDAPKAGHVRITMRVDGAGPIELASCSDGGIAQVREQIALDGAEHAVELFATGTTKGTTVRIGEFGWREQP